MQQILPPDFLEKQEIIIYAWYYKILPGAKNERKYCLVTLEIFRLHFNKLNYIQQEPTFSGCRYQQD